MAIIHEGLSEEFKYVTKPNEQEHIGSMFDSSDLLMQQIAFNLIKGKNNEIEAILANLLVKLSSGPKTTLGLKIIVFLNIFFILFSASNLLLAYFECSPSNKPKAEK